MCYFWMYIYTCKNNTLGFVVFAHIDYMYIEWVETYPKKEFENFMKKVTKL